jgi:hypothetical protein
MTKKSTDASSILGAARRAADVPRPKVAEEPAQAVPEKRVNVALRAQTHKRLKLLSVQRDMTVQDLAEELLQEALNQQGV